MQDYVKWSAVGLYVVAVFQVYNGIRSFWGDRAACDCEHPPSSSAFRSFVVYGLFAVPLLLGFLLPNVAMSSALADKKGMNLSAAASIKKTAAPAAKTLQTPANATPQLSGGNGTTAAIATPNTPQVVAATEPDTGKSAAATGSTGNASSTSSPATGAATKPSNGMPVSDEQLKQMFTPPDEYSEDLSQMGMILYKRDIINVKPEIFMETLSTIDMFKENFFGKKIELSGFVYREDDFQPNQLVVGRFAVSCCSADASPYGVLIEFPNAKAFAKDTWVKVTGTIEKGHYHDNDIFKVHAAKIEKIAAPKTPYVYPNMDPVTELKK
jgi:uncharacterized repeat protein (TIGR03943 family)